MRETSRDRDRAGDCAPAGESFVQLFRAALADRHARCRLRRRVFEVMELGHADDPASRAFDRAIIGLIVLNIAAFMAETVPSIEREWGRWLHAFELFSIAVFTIEYGLRMWTAVEVPFLARLDPLQARLSYARRPAQLIDLAAIAPFYLSFILPLDLRILRILRLLRFFKLSRYSPALHTLVRVISNERRALVGAGLVLVAAVLFAASGIYYLEGGTQPDKFGSIPESAWWAIATLTTVGYGDVTPVTPLGKLFGSLVMVTGLCVLALPVAIISTGFAQEVGRRDFVVNWSLMSRIPMLAELDARDVAEIMPLLHAHNLPPNVEVVAKGSPGDAIFFIASGKVVLRGPRDERSFGGGDVFGVVAMVDNDLHEASFVTGARTRLLKLYRADFNRLETASPAVVAHIRRLAEARKAARSGNAAGEDETGGGVA